MSSFTFYNDQTLNNLNANQLNSTALVVDSLVVNNNSIISGDLAVNGGDLVSSAAAFNLLVNATLAPPAGAGPAAIALGDAAATVTIPGTLIAASPLLSPDLTGCTYATELQQALLLHLGQVQA